MKANLIQKFSYGIGNNNKFFFNNCYRRVQSNSRSTDELTSITSFGEHIHEGPRNSNNRVRSHLDLEDIIVICRQGKKNNINSWAISKVDTQKSNSLWRSNRKFNYLFWMYLFTNNGREQPRSYHPKAEIATRMSNHTITLPNSKPLWRRWPYDHKN